MSVTFARTTHADCTSSPGTSLTCLLSLYIINTSVQHTSRLCHGCPRHASVSVHAENKHESFAQQLLSLHAQAVAPFDHDKHVPITNLAVGFVCLGCLTFSLGRMSIRLVRCQKLHKRWCGSWQAASILLPTFLLNDQGLIALSHLESWAIAYLAQSS